MSVMCVCFITLATLLALNVREEEGKMEMKTVICEKVVKNK